MTSLGARPDLTAMDLGLIVLLIENTITILGNELRNLIGYATVSCDPLATCQIRTNAPRREIFCHREFMSDYSIFRQAELCSFRTLPSSRRNRPDFACRTRIRFKDT